MSAFHTIKDTFTGLFSGPNADATLKPSKTQCENMKPSTPFPYIEKKQPVSGTNIPISKSMPRSSLVTEGQSHPFVDTPSDSTAPKPHHGTQMPSPARQTPLSKNQRKRHARANYFEAQLHKQVLANRCNRQEIYDLKAQIETLKKENTELSSSLVPKEQLLVEIENLKERIQAQGCLNTDLTFNLVESQEHNKKLSDEIEKICSEKDQMLISYRKDLNESTYDVHRQKELFQDKLQKMASEKEDLSKKHEKDLDACLRDTHKQINLLQEEIGHLKSKNEELSSLFQARITKHQKLLQAWIHIHKTHLIPWARKKDINYDSKRPSSIDKALTIMVQDALDADSLRVNCHLANKQINALQGQLLAHVKKIEAIPDEQFVQEFRNLASSIKNFSRLSFPLSKATDIRTCSIIMRSILLEGADPALWTTPMRKKGIVEAFIWSVLYKYLFDNPFYATGVGEDLPDIYISLFGIDHQHNWPKPSEPAEQWRCNTLQYLVGSTNDQIIVEGKVHHEGILAFHYIEKRREAVVDSIGEPLTRLFPSLDASKIYPIVDKAFNLAFRIYMQQCRFQVVFPELGEQYIAGTTAEMTSHGNGDSGPVGIVGSVINPGLAKWGDAHGKNLDQRLDLVPSLVLVDDRGC